VTDEVDFDGDDTELGFAPAVSVTGAEADHAPRRTRTRSRRSGLPRRLGAGAVLVGALVAMGGAYAAFATSSSADSAGVSSADVAAGKQLYQTSCITCHGKNLEGIKGQGPSLIGVGSAAAYFQVSTGRMPLSGQGAYAARKEARFTPEQTQQLAAYVGNQGGGPSIPAGDLRGGSATVADGGQLFRLNCASCHGNTFKGAPLSAGKQAPSLNDATDKQIYAAMLSGPESMPVFSDNQLTPS